MTIQKCRHFTGLSKSRCEAGVEYSDVKKFVKPAGYGVNLPCFNDPGTSCSKQAFYTPCLEHWRMVPKKLQKEILRLYRQGQEVDKNASFEYLDATVDAIRFVREKEKPGSTILAAEGQEG